AYDCASAEAASRPVAAKASKANLSFIKVVRSAKPGFGFTQRIIEKFRNTKHDRVARTFSCVSCISWLCFCSQRIRTTKYTKHTTSSSSSASHDVEKAAKLVSWER